MATAIMFSRFRCRQVEMIATMRALASTRVAFHRRIRTITAKERGDVLEIRVQRLLSRAGHLRVRRNLQLRDKAGNLSQVDLAYGLLWPVFVECKNYSKSSVPLEDAAKFKEVLRLHGLPPSRGLLVTTGTFSPRALTTGLRTIDGEQLRAWERRSYFWQRLRWIATALVLAGLAGAAVIGDDNSSRVAQIAYGHVQAAAAAAAAMTTTAATVAVSSTPEPPSRAR